MVDLDGQQIGVFTWFGWLVKDTCSEQSAQARTRDVQLGERLDIKSLPNT
jgi:hypothetical protein